MNKSITIDGIEYVQKQSSDDTPYVIVRAKESGVHAGYLESRNGSEVKLLESRRLWYWSGAASLSQMANEGVKKPDECKFAQLVSEIDILGVCEILYTTQIAKKSIESVKAWEA
jgi:hypothetical protein